MYKVFDKQSIDEAIKKLDHGQSVEQVCSEMGISTSTLYRWRKQYSEKASSSSIVKPTRGAWFKSLS